ncbi:unnamed protein product [Polarella glacialis]|uniref:Uncharacterized protein n=1 Tax=Polarella glacialis TaxID=89957 RepID=A0A813GTV6_POLGL|nr:unnamed protein product [Polarella glacialis]
MPGDAKTTPDQDDELQRSQISENQHKLQRWGEMVRRKRLDDPTAEMWRQAPSVDALTQHERRIDEYERLNPNAAQRLRHGHRDWGGGWFVTGCEQFDMGRCAQGIFCPPILTSGMGGLNPMPPALWPSKLSPPPKRAMHPGDDADGT